MTTQPAAVPVSLIGLMASTVGLGLALLGFYQVESEDLREQALNQQTARAERLAQGLEAYLISAQQVVQTTTALFTEVPPPPLASPDPQSSPPAISRVFPSNSAAIADGLQRILSSTPAEAVYGIGVWYQPYAWDPDLLNFSSYQSRPLAGSPLPIPDPNQLNSDYRQQPWYQAAVSGQGDPVFTQPFVDSDGVYVTVAEAFYQGEALAGVVRVDVVLPQLNDFIVEASLNGAEFSYMTSGEGSLFIHPFQEQLLAAARQAGEDPDSLNDLSHEDWRRFQEGYFTSPRQEAQVVVNPVGWKLYINSAQKDWLVEVGQLQRDLLGVGGLAWTGLALLWLGWQRINNQTQRTLKLEHEKARLEREISERKRTEMMLRQQEFQLREQAKQLDFEEHHDSLTKLPNRNWLLIRLQTALDRAHTYSDYQFALLFLDLDRFKVLNDSLGHDLGDQVLKGLAKKLEACLRVVDAVARWGGDEFVILLDYLSEEKEALKIAEQIQATLRTPLVIDRQDVFVTASIGIALSNPTYDKPEDLLRDADIAVHRAKVQGRNCYEIFNPDMHSEAVALLQIESNLRRVIDQIQADPDQEQELQVYYQPILCLETQQVEGFEALVRWQHPTLGMVQPDRFIYTAEETGLITAIDEWILRQACLQLQKWQQQFPTLRPLSVSVNLSGRDFTQPRLLNWIDRVLEETGLPPSNLKLEMTESSVMSEMESVIQILHQLRTRGIPICIDDFGTGYSSLSYLHRFPIDVLKIDRAFVDHMGEQAEQDATVKAIITLAHSLNLTVIAEGIETPAQAAQLRRLGAEQGQGYYFSRPLNLEAATDYLRRCQGSLIPS
ncbi:MAG: EAL domain-containing protein [Cyanobacteriota bacterium]|nr:EAL domain-containing protein [Cyanobacteriota bacterium]